MYSKLLTKVMYPLLKVKFPMLDNTVKNLQVLHKTQWQSFSETQALQEKRLEQIVSFAYNHTPYYHRLFKKRGLKPADIRKPSDLEKLPVLTKDIIRKNLPDLVPINVPLLKLIPTATGGSTGEPMKFYIDDNWNAWNMAAAYRQWGWAGYHIGDKMVYLWSALQDISSQEMLKTRLLNKVHRTKFLDAHKLTEQTIDEYIKILRSFQPKVINAYASAIYVIAQYMERKGITGIHPKAILTSCETLFPYQRDVIERSFDCEVYDYYSGRDTTFHAGECSAHAGYHMAMENAVVEFIKNDEPVAAGEIGKMVITDLQNYAMPFIRYEIGDLGMLSSEPCSCGRTLPLIKEISGRIRDVIVTKDGKYLTGAFISTLFYDNTGLTKGIQQYQFIQKTKEYAILKVVKGEDYSEDTLQSILKKINEQCRGMRIDVEFVDVILPTPSGKYRPILSEVDMNI
jgi:phenylacetate-CoA ligase